MLNWIYFLLNSYTHDCEWNRFIKLCTSKETKYSVRKKYTFLNTGFPISSRNRVFVNRFYLYFDVIIWLAEVTTAQILHRCKENNQNFYGYKTNVQYVCNVAHISTL